MSNELQKTGAGIEAPAIVPSFQTGEGFGLLQRMAKALCCSELVPETYRGEANMPNCMIALDIAQRTGFNVLMVMQNLYVVHGRPGWSSQFIIAAVNQTGKITSLRFEMGEAGTVQTGGRAIPNRTCFAYATDIRTGKPLESPVVSMEMARAEGWIERNGSKWKTMPELMLRYRAATFFGRLYFPEVLMGMETQDEIIDIGLGEKAKIAKQIDFGQPKPAPEPENQDVKCLPVPAETKTPGDESDLSIAGLAPEPPITDASAAHMAAMARAGATPATPPPAPPIASEQSPDKPTGVQGELDAYFTAKGIEFAQVSEWLCGKRWFKDFDANTGWQDVKKSDGNKIWSSREGIAAQILDGQ